MYVKNEKVYCVSWICRGQDTIGIVEFCYIHSKMGKFISDHQAYFICAGTIIALVTAYFVEKKKKQKNLTLIFGIIAAMATLLFSILGDRKQEQFQNTLTGGEAHPYLLVWESPYFDKKTANAYLISFIVRVKGDNAINNLNVSIDDFYGYYMNQFFTVAAFHEAFSMIPHHYSLQKSLETFNSNFSQTLPRVDVHDVDRVYVAAVPQHYNQLVVNKNPPPINYTVYFAWANGSVRIDLQFSDNGKHLELIKQTILLNGKAVPNPADYLEYTFQD